MGLAGEHDRAAIRVKAQHEHSVVVPAEGEVLVLVEVGWLASGRVALHEPHALQENGERAATQSGVALRNPRFLLKPSACLPARDLAKAGRRLGSAARD